MVTTIQSNRTNGARRIEEENRPEVINGVHCGTHITALGCNQATDLWRFVIVTT